MYIVTRSCFFFGLLNTRELEFIWFNIDFDTSRGTSLDDTGDSHANVKWDGVLVVSFDDNSNDIEDDDDDDTDDNDDDDDTADNDDDDDTNDNDGERNNREDASSSPISVLDSTEDWDSFRSNNDVLDCNGDVVVVIADPDPVDVDILASSCGKRWIFCFFIFFVFSTFLCDSSTFGINKKGISEDSIEGDVVHKADWEGVEVVCVDKTGYATDNGDNDIGADKGVADNKDDGDFLFIVFFFFKHDTIGDVNVVVVLVVSVAVDDFGSGNSDDVDESCIEDDSMPGSG